MVLRREVWDDLGGFEPRYFAYHEDVELCRRCWHRDLELVNVPSAVVVHRYEFGREPSKLYLSERNRLLFVLTAYEARTLVVLALPFIAVEVAALAGALATGTAGKKLAGWWWLVRNRRWIAQRRRKIQAERRVSDAQLAHLFATRLDAGNYPLPGWLKPLDALLARVLVRRPPLPHAAVTRSPPGRPRARRAAPSSILGAPPSWHGAEQPRQEHADRHGVHDREQERRYAAAPNGVLPELDRAVVPDRVAAQVLGERKELRDAEHGADTSTNLGLTSLRPCSCRRERDRGEERNADGDRECVATLAS